MNFLKCFICKNAIKRFRVKNGFLTLQCFHCGSNNGSNKKVEVFIKK